MKKINFRLILFFLIFTVLLAFSGKKTTFVFAQVCSGTARECCNRVYICCCPDGCDPVLDPEYLHFSLKSRS